MRNHSTTFSKSAFFLSISFTPADFCVLLWQTHSRFDRFTCWIRGNTSWRLVPAKLDRRKEGWRRKTKISWRKRDLWWKRAVRLYSLIFHASTIHAQLFPERYRNMCRFNSGVSQNINSHLAYHWEQRSFSSVTSYWNRINGIGG